MRIQEVPKERRVELGNRAEGLIKDEMVQSILSEMARMAMDDLIKAQPHSTEAVNAHVRLKVIEEFNTNLRLIVTERDRIIRELAKKDQQRGVPPTT